MSDHAAAAAAATTAAPARKTLMIRPDQYEKLASVAGQLDITLISVIEILCQNYVSVGNLRPYAAPFKVVKQKPTSDRLKAALQQLSPAEIKDLLASLGTK